MVVLIDIALFYVYPINPQYNARYNAPYYTRDTRGSPYLRFSEFLAIQDFSGLAR